MIKIVITNQLEKEIFKKFGKKECLDIIDLFETLKENPNKGKKVGSVGSVLIKEIKYKSYRFYFLTNRYELKLLLKGEIVDLLFKFIRMSKKNNQQKVINEIKNILKNLENK
jgi:flavodoxin